MDNKQLNLVANSYDRTIELGKNGIDLYENLPNEIINDPNYLKYKREVDNGYGGSENKEIEKFLSPK